MRPAIIKAEARIRNATAKFCELAIGARFEFRGRRYEKVAPSIARDEERCGNAFHADTFVLAHAPAA